MNNRRGGGKVALAGLIVVIVLAGFFIARQSGVGTGPRVPQADWACEECDHRFTDAIRLEPRECPVCGGEAVRSYMFYNEETGELVEVYRAKPDPDVDLEAMDLPAEAFLLVKKPGEEWREPDERMEIEFGIPVRVEDARHLRPAPPGSRYRRD